MRALLVAMDRWVRDGIAPPASQHPLVDRGTLVDVNKLAFPAIPGVQSPRNLKAGFRISNQFLKGGAGFGTELPLLVPRVDADGNERSGIRVPEIAVPLATYTGWNFRAASVGMTTHLYPLIGSYIPFARTEAERNERKDPRLSVAERYSSRDAYMAKIREAADKLVKQRYLLAEDLGSVAARAAAHYELIMGGPEPGSR